MNLGASRTDLFYERRRLGASPTSLGGRGRGADALCLQGSRRASRGRVRASCVSCGVVFSLCLLCLYVTSQCTRFPHVPHVPPPQDRHPHLQPTASSASARCPADGRTDTPRWRACAPHARSAVPPHLESRPDRAALRLIEIWRSVMVRDRRKGGPLVGSGGGGGLDSSRTKGISSEF